MWPKARLWWEEVNYTGVPWLQPALLAQAGSMDNTVKALQGADWALNLSADSMLHSWTRFARHQTDAFSLSSWFAIVWPEQKNPKNKKNPALKTITLQNNKGELGVGG